MLELRRTGEALETVGALVVAVDNTTGWEVARE